METSTKESIHDVVKLKSQGKHSRPTGEFKEKQDKQVTAMSLESSRTRRTSKSAMSLGSSKTSRTQRYHWRVQGQGSHRDVTSEFVWEQTIIRYLCRFCLKQRRKIPGLMFLGTIERMLMFFGNTDRMLVFSGKIDRLLGFLSKTDRLLVFLSMSKIDRLLVFLSMSKTDGLLVF